MKDSEIKLLKEWEKFLEDPSDWVAISALAIFDKDPLEIPKQT